MSPLGNQGAIVSRPLLAGARILCVEDEAIVAMLVEDILLDNGCEVVGPFARIAPALAAVAAGGIDGAVLDVNLRGERSYSIAAMLVEKGIPYVFATGYGEAGLDAAYRSVPIVQKPFQASELIRALAKAMGKGGD